MSGYAITLTSGSVVTVDSFRFGPDEDLLIWRDDAAPWPFVIGRSEWLCHSAASNVINAAASGGKRRMKRSKVENQLAQYLADRSTGAGPMFGRVLLEKDHYAAGKDGHVYVYQGGVYVPAASHVKVWVQARARDKWTRNIQAEVLAWLHTAAEELDDHPDPDIINVQNGLLRWTGSRWKLSNHDPELRTTMQLPVTYDPKARCPVFDGYLESSQPDECVRQFLDEWAGYNLTSDCGQEKALINIGKGGDGKSVFLYVMEKLIGSGNVSSRTLQSIAGGVRFATADLYGALANICADLSADELKATGSFKELVSGDLMTAEKKMKDSFQFHNIAKLSFSANEVPASPDGSPAFFDRWLVVMWPRTFRGTSDQDTELKSKIADDPGEMSGVLNRALAGLTRLRQRGQFTTCGAMEDAKGQFRLGADNVTAYVLDVAPDKAGQGKEKAKTWYEDYRAWCKDNGHGTLSAKKFYPRLRNWQPMYGIALKQTKQSGYEYFRVEAVGGNGKGSRRRGRKSTKRKGSGK